MNARPDMLTEAQVRASFWTEAPPRIRRRYLKGRRQNAYPCDVRVAWCDWVDAAHRAGRLSDALAQAVTL